MEGQYTPWARMKDQFGNDLNLGNAGQIYLPPFPTIKDFRDHAQAVRDCDVKDNDVIIAGYPKTGTHWHIEIVNMLLRGSAEYVKVAEGNVFLDMVAPPPGSNPPGSEPKVFFTHLPWNMLPKQALEKKVKILYLKRNPKDTLVSLYNHARGHTPPLGYDCTWSQFYDTITTFGFWYGDWFDYNLEFERILASQNQVPVFVSHFEQLKKDPVGQIEKLDGFLGTNRGAQVCRDIAEACSFTKLKAQKDQADAEFNKKIFKPNATGFYRKGEIGDWKNWFTVAQSERFDQLYEKRMKGSNIQFYWQ